MPRGSQPGPRPNARKGNTIRIEGEIAYVELTKGQTAIIDAVDVPLIAQRTWYAVKNYAVQGYYAKASRFVDEAGPRTLYMHRFLMTPPDDRHVDHRNHDTLDNRRSNLRVVTEWQNHVNRKVPSQIDNQSGVRGVYIHRPRGGTPTYMARVSVARYFPFTDDGLKQAEACAIELRQRIGQLAD